MGFIVTGPTTAADRDTALVPVANCNAGLCTIRIAAPDQPEVSPSDPLPYSAESADVSATGRSALFGPVEGERSMHTFAVGRDDRAVLVAIETVELAGGPVLVVHQAGGADRVRHAHTVLSPLSADRPLATLYERAAFEGDAISDLSGEDGRLVLTVERMDGKTAKTPLRRTETGKFIVE